MVRQRAACSGSMHPAVFRRGVTITAGVIVMLASWGTHLRADDTTRFTLTSAVPNDVLLCVIARHNPQRQFINDYWQDIFDDIRQRGLDTDVAEIFAAALGRSAADEFQRLKDRAWDLISKVDWDRFCTAEVVFAERLNPPMRLAGRNAAIAPPDLVWLFRTDRQSATHNTAALTAILQALTEEINAVADAEVLAVEHARIHGAEMASIDFLASVPDAPRLPLSVAQAGDVVLLSFGHGLRDEVLGLLGGAGGKIALASDPRFQTAFASLPPATDSMEFFDIQQLTRSMRMFIDSTVAMVSAPGDDYDNTDMDPQAAPIHMQALAAYRHGDYGQALKLTHDAHAVDPDNCIIQYNLACFSALTGEHDAALSWLERAVDSGFWAPRKISEDSDLAAVRDDPRYHKTLEQATRLARRRNVEDVVINASKTGEAYKLSLQAMQRAERGQYEQALELIEQAAEVAPADSRVLYNRACFHARLGHHEQALRFLEKAVEGGFYCPGHIAVDADLKSIRDSERYAALLDRAREQAAGRGSTERDSKLALLQHLVDRLLDTVGVLDYNAVSHSTVGHDTISESRTALIKGAEQHPIYKVFGRQQPIDDFQRYLPRETMSFSVHNGINPIAAYDYLLDSVRGAGPAGLEVLEHWRHLQTQLGFDVRRDVLGWIDGAGVAVTLENNGGWVSLVKVTDEARARAQMGRMLDLAAAKIQELSARIPPLAMLTSRRSPVNHEGLEGFESLHVTFSPGTPVVWGVADGHLILGSSAHAVALCLDTARGRHPGIRENPRVLAEALLPEGPCAAVSLTDLRTMGQDLAMAMGMVSMMSGPLAMSIPDEQGRTVVSKITGLLAKLTPVLAQIDFYQSSASMTTFDGRSWHSRKITHYVAPADHGSGGVQ